MEALKQVEGLIAAKLSLFKSVLTLMRLEARLASLSVFPMLLSMCMILIVLMTFWLLISLLIGYGIYFISNNYLLTLFLLFLLNLVVLLALAKFLAVQVKNMSFAKTRSYFSEQVGKGDEFTKTIASSNCGNRQKDTPTTSSGDGI
ncbi:MAG: hypothetical protein QM652_07900 [Legionella sp.]|uniref:hypothetical protein n=1 Tax=Legionella sp. TaxID=459 RepID=UPI0039E323B2